MTITKMTLILEIRLAWKLPRIFSLFSSTWPTTNMIRDGKRLPILISFLVVPLPQRLISGTSLDLLLNDLHLTSYLGSLLFNLFQVFMLNNSLALRCPDFFINLWPRGLSIYAVAFFSTTLWGSWLRCDSIFTASRCVIGSAGYLVRLRTAVLTQTWFTPLSMNLSRPLLLNQLWSALLNFLSRTRWFQQL